MKKEEEIVPAGKNEDMGLGAKVIQENRSRFVNPDGTFNVHRKGMFERGAFSPYHAFLSMSWARFYGYVLLVYLFANFVFTGLYFAGGSHAFTELAQAGAGARFGELFFYSIQVITTLGSSVIQPATLFSKAVFSLEALTGMLGFAVGAGLIFARLSNPATKIIFSKNAVVAPYRGSTAFMVRIINGRSNELVNVSAVLTVALIEKNGKRGFHQVSLERDQVLVFPLNWTIVHPITKESPLYGMSANDLVRAQAEFLLSITGVDQDLSKTVYARHSYLGSEVIVGAKFSDVIEQNSTGAIVVDPDRIHEVEKAELPKFSGEVAPARGRRQKVLS